MVDRILHSSVVYPAAYGYIPQTLCDDGDHLDVLLLLSTGIELTPGCIISARPVALLRMKDEEGEDNKVIAVPTNDPRMDEITSLESIPKHLLREIENFFDTYKHLEQSKTTEVLGWADKQEAFDAINEGISLYLEQ
jgi:inorganic pyrophosphatase